MATTQNSWTPKKWGKGFNRNCFSSFTLHKNIKNLYMALQKQNTDSAAANAVASKKKKEGWAVSLKSGNRKIELTLTEGLFTWRGTSWARCIPALGRTQKWKEAERAKELKGTFLTSEQFVKWEKKKLPAWILHSRGPLIVDLNL